MSDLQNDSVAKREKVIGRLAEGRGHSSIASELKICRQTVRRWEKTLRSSGTEALMLQGGPGRPSKLSDSELHQLREAVTRPPSENLGYGGWSLKLVAKYIRMNFGIDYRDANVSRLIRSLGFSVKDLR